MRVRTESKRELIVDEASKVFFEVGYERASMAEISARVGGSKATLYGYFPSKELLFVEVARRVGEQQIGPAFEVLNHNIDGDEATTLRRFGEGYLQFVSNPLPIAIQRTMIAESGHTAIGQMFFESGPKVGFESLADFFKRAIERGRFRQADPSVLVDHLFALFGSEVLPRLMLGLPVNTSKANLRRMVDRAVTAFMGAYGASGAERADGTSKS